MEKYDYVIVGAGLYGAVFAHEAKIRGKKCLVIDKRDHLGGNVYCENKEGINIHTYGAHIFHTSNDEIWNYVNQFVTFNTFINSPVANYNGEIYNLPFNMNTFNRLWGVVTPQQAKNKIEEQKKVLQGKEATNLEEQAISLIGTDIYEKLIKGYTEKQWGRKCRELPNFIIKRLPVRYTYDNNYFNDKYQGIPIGGYNKLVEGLLEGIDVKLNTDYIKFRSYFDEMADKIVFTGMIDEFYEYKFGVLEYRTLKFETERKEISNYQGNAVVNYTSKEIPYTRIIEHKHFEFGNQEVTYITKEYPKEWENGDEPYYPVLDEKNIGIYEMYKELADKEKKIIFGGRLGEYKYYDMHNVIKAALDKVKDEIQ